MHGAGPVGAALGCGRGIDGQRQFNALVSGLVGRGL
jgi:hypothetical protein